jgi:hypothetical protein|tara:strand:- start:498 stop:1331 length:834 start_codon:yes stop_codon:yes gene_type:complete
MARKVNYLNNKDILKEIHKSKSTFCSFVDSDYNQFDIILLDLDKINIRTIADAKRNKAKRLQHIDFEARKLKGEKVKLAECEIDYRKMVKEDLIFRIMTFDHIPDEPGRKKTPKTIADHKVKLNFPPFKHYKFDMNGELVCVGKSHWTGGLENGEFTLVGGKSTNKLAMMWMKLCDRYATRGNVRGYTYNDEMRGQAILQLAQIGLQFDESKSDNPFAYYTAAVTNSFVRVINIEKRAQNIRDDILEMNDMNPSYTRQNAGDWEAQQRREKLFQDKK